MLAQIINMKDKDFLNIEMENNNNKYYLLMRILQDLGCTLERYYWRSKLDNEYIEYFEPKIYDVFDFVLDASGDRDQFIKGLEIFKRRSKNFDKLPTDIEPLTEEEIQELARKFYFD